MPILDAKGLDNLGAVVLLQGDFLVVIIDVEPRLLKTTPKHSNHTIGTIEPVTSPIDIQIPGQELLWSSMRFVRPGLQTR